MVGDTMDIKILNQSIQDIQCDMVIVNVFEDVDKLHGAAQSLDRSIGCNISMLVNDGEIRGKFGEITVIHNFDRFPAKKIMLIGLGKQKEFTLDKIRQVGAIALQHCRKCCAKKVATVVHGAGEGKFDPEEAAQALTEGILLGLYKFDAYKTNKEKDVAIEELIIIENDSDKINAIIAGTKKGKILAEATNFTRDLVNHPGNFMTPRILADKATLVAETYGLDISILERADLEREGMGAMLAVAQGSDEPPKLIVIKYSGDPGAEVIALVGKGVTFDSGGISIKPSEGMGEMKEDMAGGATVIGCMMAIGMLRPKMNVTGIIPATENMPGGNALKPGDIITTMSGKTVEIITTDAEGRLILADAITFAKQLGAKKIIDIATLTGACVVALGNVASGIITNNKEWCAEVLSAAGHAGERVWELPNFPEYKEQIKGVLADLKNSGGRHAGAITAGVFISEFAEDTPWVHIDIAGTASTAKPNAYYVKGATGVGVRTLAQLVLNLEKQ
jgi:leucyl aminopeptidase